MESNPDKGDHVEYIKNFVNYVRRLEIGERKEIESLKKIAPMCKVLLEENKLLKSKLNESYNINLELRESIDIYILNQNREKEKDNRLLALSEEIEKKDKENAALVEELQIAKKRAEKDKNKITSLKVKLNDAKAEKERLNSKYEESNSLNVILEQKVDDFRSKADGLSKNVKDLNEKSIQLIAKTDDLTKKNESILQKNKLLELSVLEEKSFNKNLLELIKSEKETSNDLYKQLEEKEIVIKELIKENGLFAQLLHESIKDMSKLIDDFKIIKMNILEKDISLIDSNALNEIDKIINYLSQLIKEIDNIISKSIINKYKSIEIVTDNEMAINRMLNIESENRCDNSCDINRKLIAENPIIGFDENMKKPRMYNIQQELYFASLKGQNNSQNLMLASPSVVNLRNTRISSRKRPE